MATPLDAEVCSEQLEGWGATKAELQRNLDRVKDDTERWLPADVHF
jgi:hypothetical protein